MAFAIATIPSGAHRFKDRVSFVYDQCSQTHTQIWFRPTVSVSLPFKGVKITSIQYISDSKGKTTGVFIPVVEWERLKKQYEGLEEAVETMPEWHKHIVLERLGMYKANPDVAVPFDEALAALENE